jgi:prepilin-type N-terminal cleavage/methylation domain-containing protein
MCYSKRSGFTLVELLIVISIMGVLSAAAATTVSLVMNTSTTAMGQNRELGEVHMVGSWISKDMKNATAVQTTVGDTLCSMQCSVGEGFATENVTYLLDSGERTLKRTSQLGSDPPKTITIARSIDGDSTIFTCENTSTKYYNLTVTADYDNVGNPGVTRVYKISRGY